MCVDAPISPPVVSYGNIWTSSCGVPPCWTFEINYCLYQCILSHGNHHGNPSCQFQSAGFGCEIVFMFLYCWQYDSFLSLSLLTKHLGAMNRSRSACDIDNSRFLKLQSEKNVVKSNMLTSFCWSEMVISWLSKLIFGTCWVVNQQIG